MSTLTRRASNNNNNKTAPFYQPFLPCLPQFLRNIIFANSPSFTTFPFFALSFSMKCGVDNQTCTLININKQINKKIRKAALYQIYPLVSCEIVFFVRKQMVGIEQQLVTFSTLYSVDLDRRC